MDKKVALRSHRARLMACTLLVLSLAAASSSAVAQFVRVSVPSGEIRYSCSSGAATNLYPTDDLNLIGDGDIAETYANQEKSICSLLIGNVLGKVKLFKIGTANLKAKIDNTPEEDDPVKAVAESTLTDVNFADGIVQYSSRTLKTDCDLFICTNEVTYNGLTFAGDSKKVDRTTASTTYHVDDYSVPADPGLCGILSQAKFTGDLIFNKSASSANSRTYTPMRLKGVLSCDVLGTTIGYRFANVDIADVVTIETDGKPPLLSGTAVTLK